MELLKRLRIVRKNASSQKEGRKEKEEEDFTEILLYPSTEIMVMSLPCTEEE